MGKFNKTGKREMPALNTSSLPDLIFTLLFFFMIVTTMRDAFNIINAFFVHFAFIV